MIALSIAKQATPAIQEPPPSTATVQRGKLAAMVSQYGTLTYRARSDGSPYVVINQARGTYTELPNAGDKIAYGSTRRDGNDVDIWVMDPADPKTDHMLAKLEGGGWEPLDWSPDDKKIMLKEEISINQAYLWLVPLKCPLALPV